VLSFAEGLRAALREDPDVVMLGEMRDLASISAALTLAETGHLVLTTLHTKSAAESVDRIVDVFPPNQQQQVRTQLSSVLEGIVSQRLLPKKGGGLILAYEVLIATPAVRSLIREGKLIKYRLPFRRVHLLAWLPWKTGYSNFCKRVSLMKIKPWKRRIILMYKKIDRCSEKVIVMAGKVPRPQRIF